MHGEVTAWTMSKMPNFDLQLLSVTLTFELEAWILRATHRPIMLNNIAKLFYNPSMHDEVTARTRNC
jgi:hypothetical protein